MNHASGLSTNTQITSKKVVISVAIFLLIAIAGLTYVKWWPYYYKAVDASIKHSIGDSIVSGKSANAPAPSWQSAWNYAAAYYKSVWKAAVLGILLGSLIQVLIPARWLLRMLGKASLGSTALGGLASLPAMMCTCCAAPIAVGMRKKNASVGAALAFWLGNPALNPATLVFMTFVLSWKFTVLRVVFGLILTFGVSYYANRFAGNVKTTKMLDNVQENLEVQATRPLLSRWLKSLWQLTLYVVPAYILSVLLLGAFRAWMFPAVGESLTNSILLILLFAVAGMLFVIPTAAEIPIIQTMMSFGLGSGPAAALLLTLPVVSLPSLLIVYKSFPKRVLLFVTGSVVFLGILSGIAGMYLL
jgi:uncharacterized membrane protein YraQ (UPF0718 family)